MKIRTISFFQSISGSIDNLWWSIILTLADDIADMYRLVKEEQKRFLAGEIITIYKKPRKDPGMIKYVKDVDILERIEANDTGFITT